MASVNSCNLLRKDYYYKCKEIERLISALDWSLVCVVGKFAFFLTTIINWSDHTPTIDLISPSEDPGEDPGEVHTH